VRAQILARAPLLLLLLDVACARDPQAPEEDHCRATYAKLEALGCIEMTKQLFAHGCFVADNDLIPSDCDTSVLKPCTDEIEAFERRPGGWGEPLDSFLMHDCDPNGPNVFEMPKPDKAALLRAKTARDAVAAAEQAAAQQAAAEKRAAMPAALAQARQRSIIKVGKPEIHGSFESSKAKLSKVLNDALPSFRQCHAVALVDDPLLIGKVSIQFAISSNGTVPSAVVAESTIRPPQVGHCFSKAVKQLRFAPTGTSGTAIVTVPFELELAK
jgi:hypothetical protein